MQSAYKRVSSLHAYGLKDNPLTSLSRRNRCGGAIGVYFLVKRCSLLYLHSGNGAFVQAPYLDVHGEVDMSMRYVLYIGRFVVANINTVLSRRGRRQYLHGLRWEEVRKIWLQHGIPTLIARKLESTVDSGGWESL